MKKEFVDSVDAMTSKPVGHLILKNAVPTIITMMVTAFYNTADTFFVSQLGTSASGAVGIIFTLMSLIQAVGFMIGMGSGAITSRALGSGDLKKAGTYCSTAMFSAFLFGCVFAVLGMIFNEKLVKLLGATETILPYAKDYAKYIVLASPFMMSSFVMNNQLRFQGRAAFSMIGMVTGGLLNCVLDPLFIFVFDLGISGAAVATFFSQIVSFAILLSMFIFKKSAAEFSFKNISRSAGTYGDIITTGLPSLFRQGTASVSGIVMNLSAAKYGALLFSGGMFAFSGGFDFSAFPQELSADAAVAGMSIANRIFMMLLAVAIGLGQGFQPVVGINLGAKKYSRVKEAVSFLLKTTSVIMIFLGITVFLSAEKIAAAFRDDSLVVAIASTAMRAQAVVLPFHSLIFGTNMLLQVAGVKKTATVLSSMRQGIVFFPCIFILPELFELAGICGILGVQLTPAVSDLVSALVALPFLLKFLNSLKEENA